MIMSAKGFAQIAVMLLTTITTDAARIQDDSDIISGTDLLDLDDLAKSVEEIDKRLFEHDDATALDAALELPPKEDVQATMATAKEHAEMTRAAAMETQQNISKKMEEAVQNGQMIDASILVDLNNAISRDKTATELVEMTGNYKGKVEEFFGAIDRCKINRAQSAAALDQMTAEHRQEEAKLQLEKDAKEVEHATSAAEKEQAEKNLEQAMQNLNQALEDQKKAMNDLRHSQNRAEILEVKKLLALFAEIKEHGQNIKTKDETINAGIHPTVKTATHSVRDWANAELKPLCEKYQNVTRVKKAFADRKSWTCGEALKVLVAHVQSLTESES